MKERILYIDMAKGIAIIAITMLHFSFNLEGESARLIASFNHSWDTRSFFLFSGLVAALGGVILESKKMYWCILKIKLSLCYSHISYGPQLLPHIYMIIRK